MYIKTHMLPNILLNGKKFDLQFFDLPILVHGQTHSGASYFSLILLAHMVKQGVSLVFFSGYLRGSESFLALIPEVKEVGLIQRKEDIDKQKDKRIIIVKSGNEELFLHILRALVDEKRVFFIKNIEIFTTHLHELLTRKETIIISGDVERFQFKIQLMEKRFATKILFSDLPSFSIHIPPIEKFEGIFIHQTTSGIIRVQ